MGFELREVKDFIERAIERLSDEFEDEDGMVSISDVRCAFEDEITELEKQRDFIDIVRQMGIETVQRWLTEEKRRR